jgi:hypothetical protein
VLWSRWNVFPLSCLSLSLLSIFLCLCIRESEAALLTRALSG